MAKKQVQNNIKKNFTIVPNELIEDTSLSDRARFLFVYMASKSENWKFYNTQLAKMMGYSIDTLRKYINELVKSGWISKIPKKDTNGLFSTNDYSLNSVRISPYRKKPDTEKTRHGKNPTHTNTNSIPILNNTKKDINTEKDKLFPSFTKIWFDFYRERVGIDYRMTAVDGKALKGIIEYFKKISKGEPQDAFKFMLVNFDKWERFYQNQLKVTQLNSNLPNILNNIKNGTIKAKSTSPVSRETAERVLRNLERKRKEKRD